MRRRVFIVLGAEDFAQLLQVSRDGDVGILGGFVFEHHVPPIVGLIEDVDESREIGGYLLP